MFKLFAFAISRGEGTLLSYGLATMTEISDYLETVPSYAVITIGSSDGEFCGTGE